MRLSLGGHYRKASEDIQEKKDLEDGTVGWRTCKWGGIELGWTHSTPDGAKFSIINGCHTGNENSLR